MTTPHDTLELDGGAVVKAWTRGVPVDGKAFDQIARTASLPFIHKWVAVMPDVHVGVGATVGTVIATKGAIVPAAVGVDIGCGMSAVRTDLRASHLPDSLAALRSLIEEKVPVGRAAHDTLMSPHAAAWKKLAARHEAIVEKRPLARADKAPHQLGTLGGGNHFIELCLDEEDRVWVMLHSGSRGLGNLIGQVFIELAKRDLEAAGVKMADENLSYFREGTAHFDEYVEAVSLAQAYAAENRRLMMDQVFRALLQAKLPIRAARVEAVDCHHNYVARETHFGDDVLVTRKGAVRAGLGQLGIIPGSMGAKSFIVRGKGCAEAFESCSHGAGRVLSRGQAKRTFSVADHEKATFGIECRKDEGVIDETPMAYKPIDAVMAAQEELVEIVHTLRQVLCVKG